MSSDGSKKRPSARRPSVAPPAPARKASPAKPSASRPSARASSAEGSARPSARATRSATEKRNEQQPPEAKPAKVSPPSARASSAKPAARPAAKAKSKSVRPSAKAPDRRSEPTASAPSSSPPADRAAPPRARARRPSAPVASPPERDEASGELPVVEAEPVPEPEERRSEPHDHALQDLEDTVDRLILEADSIAGDPQARRRAAEALSELAARLGGYENEPVPEQDAGLLGGARELFSTDYYVRQWGRIAMRNRSEVVDDFGLDRTYEARVAPVFEALYRRWFRVTVEGVDHVPAEGRALVVANHGGALPWDGLMVRTALRLEHSARREARWLAEDFVYHMPFLGAFLTRVGAVRACPENAERLLDQEEVLTVFPEGIKGISKLYRQRYQLQRFGRGGYVKLALRTGTPIVPAGIVGAEDAYPLLFKGANVAKLAGLPFLPVTPTFPWLGPLGLLPLPSRWVMIFGEPIDLSSHGPEAANDALLVNRLNDEVRGRVQELVGQALSARDSAYLG